MADENETAETEAEEKAKRRAPDFEISAMRRIEDIFDELTVKAQARVLWWLNNRLEERRDAGVQKGTNPIG